VEKEGSIFGWNYVDFKTVSGHWIEALITYHIHSSCFHILVSEGHCKSTVAETFKWVTLQGCLAPALDSK
jgi:hypothetical protein